MVIGVLKDLAPENRVMLVPETIAGFVKQQIRVVVEKGAGEKAFYQDNDYEIAGAKVLDRKGVFSEASLIVSVSPPSLEEMSSHAAGKAFISIFNPLSEKELVKKLLETKVTAFSMDMVPRSTRAQAMDVLSSMATVAGYKAVLDAALNLPHFFPMFMTAAGTLKPAKVLILGAGVAGLQAIATSRKLGAVVEVFDVRAAVKEEVQSLGGKFIEVQGAKEDASAGGYAVEQDEEYKRKQQAMIQDHAANANVVICTAQIPGRKAPVLILKDTVEKMQPGSVIIDLAASSGGNCEVTRNNEIFIHHGVTIIGNSNYPNLMSSDASKMLSRNTSNFIKLLIGKDGEWGVNVEDDIVKATCITHQGEIPGDKLKQIINS